MIYKTIFFITILFSLAGCAKKYKISPDELPIAYVGQNYKQELKISGGRVVEESLKVSKNFPDNMNITVQHINDDRPDIYNFLEIKGVPQVKGKYTINISAKFYGGGDSEVNKIYNFIVK